MQLSAATLDHGAQWGQHIENSPSKQGCVYEACAWAGIHEGEEGPIRTRPNLEADYTRSCKKSQAFFSATYLHAAAKFGS